MLMMVGNDADDAHALDERAVGGGERVGVAVDALGMPVLGGHPEVALDGLGDARRSARGGRAAGRGAARRTARRENRSATRRNPTDRLVSVVGMQPPRFAPATGGRLT